LLYRNGEKKGASCAAEKKSPLWGNVQTGERKSLHRNLFTGYGSKEAYREKETPFGGGKKAGKEKD